MGLFTVEAVVLRTRSLGEADALLTLLTRSEGKLSAAAPGVRRPRSPLLGACQPFVWARFQLFRRASGLPSVRQGDVVESYRPLREDLTRMALASYAAELVDLALPEGDPHPPVFALVLTAFQLFASEPDGAALEATLRKFELRLLTMLGYRPQLEECAACGGPLTARPGQPLLFHSGHGGLLCLECGRDEGGEPMGQETVALLRHIVQRELGQLRVVKPSPRALAEMKQAMALWIEHHLGKTPKSGEFLDAVGPAGM